MAFVLKNQVSVRRLSDAAGSVITPAFHRIIKREWWHSRWQEKLFDLG